MLFGLQKWEGDEWIGRGVKERAYRSRRVGVRVGVRVGGGESEGSGSESERSGWVIMQHLVQIAQNKKRRDGDRTKFLALTGAHLVQLVSIVAYFTLPRRSRNTHAPWHVVGRLFSLPWRVRLAVLHHWAAHHQSARIRQETGNPSAVSHLVWCWPSDH